jgi:hypothetical protein
VHCTIIFVDITQTLSERYTMAILLVWDESPEQIRLFAFDEGSEAAQWALASAGKYINCDDVADGDPIDKLNLWLDGRSDAPVPTPLSNPATGPFSQVVLCGFMM